MIAVKINASRIDKAHMFKGENGTYVDLMLFENKNGPDKFGNDGFVTQGVSREARAQGVKGPIIGNWRRLEKKQAPSAPAPSRPVRPGGTRY